MYKLFQAIKNKFNSRNRQKDYYIFSGNRRYCNSRGICAGLKIEYKAELESRRANGESDVLSPDDRNYEWINECKSPELSMESLLAVFKNAIDRKLDLEDLIEYKQ